MKPIKLIPGFVLLGLLLFASSFVFAAPQNLDATAGLPGANDHPHNFSSRNTGGGIHSAAGETRICVFCHTPHNASTKGALWNRNDPIGPNGDGTFPLYGELSGRTGEVAIVSNAAAAAAAQYGTVYGEYPNGASRLCLSCHDGVTAIGEVINPGGGTIPLGGLGSILDENPSSTAVIDLDTSHPISFIYNETSRSAIDAVKGGVGDGDYILPPPGILDNLERMQCTSCHDPHYDTREVGYDLPMWRNYSGTDTADYEATCDDCHVGGSSSSGLNRTPGISNGVHPIP